jgi:hypothetical protein
MFAFQDAVLNIREQKRRVKLSGSVSLLSLQRADDATMLRRLWRLPPSKTLLLNHSKQYILAQQVCSRASKADKFLIYAQTRTRCRQTQGCVVVSSVVDDASTSVSIAGDEDSPKSDGLWSAPGRRDGCSSTALCAEMPCATIGCPLVIRSPFQTIVRARARTHLCRSGGAFATPPTDNGSNN